MVPESAIAKALGAILGAALSLIFTPPASLTGFIHRTVAAMIIGPVMGPVLLKYLEWNATFEYQLAAVTMAAFIGWWAMGTIRRILATWSGSKD